MTTPTRRQSDRQAVQAEVDEALLDDLRVLRLRGLSMTEASRTLGVSRSTCYDVIRRAGVRW